MPERIKPPDQKYNQAEQCANEFRDPYEGEIEEEYIIAGIDLIISKLIEQGADLDPQFRDLLRDALRKGYAVRMKRRSLRDSWR